MEKRGGLERVGGGVWRKEGGGLEKVCGGMEKGCRLAYFAPTHPHAQDRACAPLYAWGPGLRAALRVGTGAEERLRVVAGILGAGRVGGWGGGPGGRTGWGVGWRARWGWGWWAG